MKHDDILNGFTSPAAIIDGEGNILYANDTFVQSTGIGPGANAGHMTGQVRILDDTMEHRLTEIAHQWKQPLNALSLMVSDFSDDVRLGTATPETADYFLNDSMSMINYMASTVKDFLVYMMPDSENGSFDIRDCMPLIYRLMEPRFVMNGITYHAVCRQCGKECDLSILGSSDCKKRNMSIRGGRGSMQQAIINLVANAADAVKDRTTRDINLTVTDTDTEVHITLSDTGGGIPAKHLEKIFQSGFTTKKSGSSGLGLHITKNIVTNIYHGVITAENNQSGAVFRMSFKKSGYDV